MEERIVNFATFLSSRATEIAQMQNTLESKYLNTTKHPYQVLHKHLKRRAMSHNRYRIPSRLRKQMNIPAMAETELGQKIVKCRKHLRKHKTITFLNRSNKVSWMETHLQQAKRMRMIEYQSFKVPIHANEKNFRAIHRYLDHGSCIFDASYYFVVDGLVEGGKQIDGRTIIHPKDVGDVDQKVHKNDYCIFQLFGQEALSTINQFLQQWNYEIDGKRPVYISTLMNNSKIQSEHKPLYREIRTLDQYDLNLTDILKSIQYTVEEDLEQKVWNVDLQYFQKRFKQIQRSRYTHKRKLKQEFQKKLEMEKKNKQKIIKIVEEKQEVIDLDKKKRAMRWLLNEQLKFNGENQEQQEQLVEQLEQQQQQEQLQDLQQDLPQNQQIEVEDSKPNHNQQEQLQEDVQKEVLNILIIPPNTINPQSQIDLGYKLIINLGQGIKVWRTFHKMNIKPIGLRDIKQICLESLIPFHDFDDSEDQYQLYLKSNKKPDYWKLQFPFPFNFNWDIYPSWSLCRLIAYRSTPKRFSIIVQPSEQDLELFVKGIRKIEAESSSTKLEQEFKTNFDLISYEKHLSQIPLQRKVIGFILFGNTSLKYGKGIGQGKVNSVYSGKQTLVLYRNRNSQYYFFADCEVK